MPANHITKPPLRRLFAPLLGAAEGVETGIGVTGDTGVVTAAGFTGSAAAAGIATRAGFVESKVITPSAVL